MPETTPIQSAVGRMEPPAPSHITMPVPKVGVPAEKAGAMFDGSKSWWNSLDKTHRCPAGQKVGGKKLWLVEELLEWARAGFPCRSEWQARQALAAQNRRLNALRAAKAGAR